MAKTTKSNPLVIWEVYTPRGTHFKRKAKSISWFMPITGEHFSRRRSRDSIASDFRWHMDFGADWPKQP